VQRYCFFFNCATFSANKRTNPVLSGKKTHKKQFIYHFFLKIFGHIKKKQYFCSRFR